MSTGGLLTALLLPLLLGVSWLQLLWKQAHIAARLGYGYLLGIFAVTSMVQVWGKLGLALDFYPLAALALLLGIVPVFIGYTIKTTTTRPSCYVPFSASWQKALWWILLAILIARYGGILLEIVWRPLYPWDGWMNWAPKAKTWFELKELVPFVSRSDWISQTPQNLTYMLGNNGASTYPPLVSLIQTWTALGMGAWIDNLVNLPWMMCLMALGLAFYGQARMIGVTPWNALLWVFLLLSIPYINTHTALAGYAELWLAAFYCLAAMAFMNWSLTKDGKQGLLMILFAMACIQTKEPGVVWAATLLPAIIVALCPGRWRYVVMAAAIIGLGLWLYAGGFSIDLPASKTLMVSPQEISVPGLGKFVLEYHAVGSEFIDNDLIRGSWHLLGWVIFLLLIPVAVKNTGNHATLAPTVLILSGVLFIVVVFFFTSHYQEVLDSTTINRATMHFLPVVVYYLGFVDSLRDTLRPHVSTCCTKIAEI